jgi:hypothetical protein
LIRGDLQNRLPLRPPSTPTRRSRVTSSTSSDRITCCNQKREFPTTDQRLRDAIAEVTEVVKADADLNTGLELSIPLVPLLLDYKVNLDLGGGLDLRQ